MFFLIGDTLSLLVSAMGAFLILSMVHPSEITFPIQQTLIVTGSVLAGLAIFKMYVIKWRYVSLNDLIRIILGITIGGGISLGLTEAFLEVGRYEGAFTALLMINAVISIGAFRISKRLYHGLKASSKKQNHTIIFGGKSEGEQILRDILNNDNWDLSVYAIFDDRLIPGTFLHGVKIVGGKNEMIGYLKTHEVDQLIVAFPDYPKNDLKVMFDEIKKISPDMNIKVLPSFHSLTDNPVGIEHIREVSIDDILGREPVSIDIKTIENSISGKTILVTGAGGSIGSELIRQCAALNPSKLIALDIDETELFHINNELKDSGASLIPCVASVTDSKKMEKIFSKYNPDVLFHAAAYKHVPMMESFPDEAIKVNVGGTRSIATLACKYEVEKFIMISTDKAVNPANVMGATKRVAEEVCMAFNSRSTKTKFMSVRFGNVLGSRGSVVPLFIEQIKQGGPITITDPEMKRYFMTIPEAVLLVMQAGSMGRGGEVFVLDMGEPVKIIDMAKDLIRLHGLKPYIDIPIDVIGLRPGEKLFEELLNAEEGVLETEYEEIFKAKCSRKLAENELIQRIDQLFDSLDQKNGNSIKKQLKEIVPTYSFKEKKTLNNGIIHPKVDHSVFMGRVN